MTDQTASLAMTARRPAGQTLQAVPGLPWPLLLYFALIVVPMTVVLGPTVLTGVRILLLALILPMTVRLLAGHYGRVLPTDYLYYAFVLWQFPALSQTSPEQALSLGVSSGTEFLGGYLMGRAYIRTAEAFEALTRLLMMFLVLALPFAIFETLTSRSLLLELIRMVPGILTAPDNGSEERMGLYRVQLTFDHQIHFGMFASLAFSLTFIGMKGRISDVRRYVTSGVVAICTLLSLSSGAMLALVLHLILIAWQITFSKMPTRWYLFAGLVALAYVTVDVLSNRPPIRVFMSYATFSPGTAYYRAMIFEHGMNNVWANPIFGIGMNDWVRPSYMHSSTVDNFWLVLAFRYGIPGFLLFAAGYLIGLVGVIRRDFSADPRLRQIRLGWVFTFLGMTFSLCTVALWSNIYSFVFFMFGAGMWLITAQPATAMAGFVPAGRTRDVVRRPAAALPSRPRAGALPPASPGPDDAPPAGPKGPRYTRFPPAGPGPDGQRPDGQRPDGQRPDGRGPDGRGPDGRVRDGGPGPRRGAERTLRKTDQPPPRR